MLADGSVGRTEMQSAWSSLIPLLIARRTPHGKGAKTGLESRGRTDGKRAPGKVCDARNHARKRVRRKPRGTGMDEGYNRYADAVSWWRGL